VDEKLLQILRPEYTVISVSNDRQDGCPNKEIAAMIRRYAKECFFTDAILLPNVESIGEYTIALESTTITVAECGALHSVFASMSTSSVKRYAGFCFSHESMRRYRSGLAL
jgi:hypothetical protein